MLELSHSTAAEGEVLQGPIRRLPRRLRRAIGRTLAGFNNAYFRTPVGRWLHRRLMSGLETVVLDLELPAARAAIEWPTIAFLSDMHAGHYLTEADLLRMAEALAEMRPDLVCLGGDLINHHPQEIGLLDAALARLRAPLGIFAVPGNHDYVVPGHVEDWTAHLEARGVRVLMNRGVRLRHRGHTLWLAGVDDLTEGQPCLREALAGRLPEEPAILLSHHPDVFQEAAARAVDLQLSGHTHGGQVRVFGWAPVHHSRNDWVSGVYARGDARLFVGRGAGVTALPLRLGTRSEITLLRPRGPRPAG